MIRILQLSDLHIVNDAHGNNLKELLLQTARERFAPLQAGEKLLVLTGDFHFFNERDYDKSIEFIRKLTKEMGIVMEQDVFLIPGNHDVFSAENTIEKIKQSSIVQAVKADTTLLQDDNYICILLERFEKYSSFCRDLGIYTEDESPASVHVRTWRNKLNLIHLNTCLVADGIEKQNQLLDTKKTTSIHIDNDLPCIALGHNSFFDLHSEVQTEISALFYRLGVKAYLCGDRHKLERNRYQQDIKLMSGYGDIERIPNIVCSRSSADVTDDYSDIGCIIHEWDTVSGNVALNSFIWDSKNDQSRFDVKMEENAYNLKHSLAVGKKTVSQSQNAISNFDPSALVNYQNYIKDRCSEIDINGLPTNNVDIARRYELSKLFVSPRLHKYGRLETADSPKESGKGSELFKTNNVQFEELDDFLSFFEDVALPDFIPPEGTFRYLILAGPGAGKSTLLKRIASTYCFPEEYLSDSLLTNRELFPIWIRCRDIKDQSYSIWEAINSIPKLGEWNPELISSNAFRNLVTYHIENGTALLLIDGLDEIGSDFGRNHFVEHLNSFINHNKKVNVIITSREKGFSVISNQSFNSFSSFRISDLSDKDIVELCKKWFALVYGENEGVRKDCQNLTRRIIGNDRLKRLAKNPLMLTTLLIVDRRTGSLPTKRAGLYHDATRVLLETWNSDVHNNDAIDLEEAKNQLAYVAFQMTTNYKHYRNRITRTELIKLLRDVREECSNLVSGNVCSVDTVIRVVEQRSALLVQTGTEKVSDGHLEPIYEFQHTTFQEYLAAYAVCIGCFPGSSTKMLKGSVLEQYILVSNMKEVILLSAAMDPAIASYLVDIIQKKIQNTKTEGEREKLCEILICFIADEAGLSKSEIRTILKTCRDGGIPNSYEPLLRQIAQGKYKQNLLDFFRESDIELHDGYDNYYSLGELLTGEITDPYDFYLKNCYSMDESKKVKAFSVLSNALFLKKESLEEEMKERIRTDAFTAIRDKNLHIAKAGFDVIRFANIIESNTQLSFYLNSISYYINEFKKIPPVITIKEGRIKDISKIEIETPLSMESIELIIAHFDSEKNFSALDYRENLFLAVCAALSCEDKVVMERIITSLDKLTAEMSTKSKNYFLLDYLSMGKIMQACSTASNVAENAIMNYVNKNKLRIENILTTAIEQKYSYSNQEIIEMGSNPGR